MFIWKYYQNCVCILSSLIMALLPLSHTAFWYLWYVSASWDTPLLFVQFWFGWLKLRETWGREEGLEQQIQGGHSKPLLWYVLESSLTHNSLKDWKTFELGSSHVHRKYGDIPQVHLGPRNTLSVLLLASFPCFFEVHSLLIASARPYNCWMQKPYLIQHDSL